VQSTRDFITRKELGIRIKGRQKARVIRWRDGVWAEIGQDYELPIESALLNWSAPGIPSSILAVALRIYELDNPGTELRSMLSRKVRNKPHQYRPKRTFEPSRASQVKRNS
jgi:hypothetical protein